MYPDFQFRLTRQAALALLISSAFSANGFAAAVARVDFAIGPVNAVGPDGKERPIGRGAEINTGDTVLTSTGRAQLRFTDGAYVSLQPQSQFKVDDYRYEGKTDGSEKGFFSLLKGGLRTITGAIGRVNRGGYQVQTPTATIGIRGTEYLAALGNSLTVSVGGGVISLTNNAGEFLVGAGQSAFVADQNSLPTITTEKPVLPPAGTQEGTQPPEKQEFMVGEQTDAAGNPAIVAGTVLPSGPGYTAAFAAGIGTSTAHLECLAGVCGVPNGTVIFDATGALHFESTDFPTSYFVDIGTARVVEGGSAGGVIAWGRWGEGTVLAGGSWNNQPIGAGQGFHYVVGVPTATMPASGIAGYSLTGATTPTFSDGTGGGLGTGTVTSGILAADFGAGMVGALMDLSFTGASGTSNYHMAASGSVLGAAISGFGGTTFVGGAIDVCGAFPCNTGILGFFAGSNAAHAGLAYDILASSGFHISGVTAFTQSQSIVSGSGYAFAAEGLADFGFGPFEFGSIGGWCCPSGGVFPTNNGVITSGDAIFSGTALAAYATDGAEGFAGQVVAESAMDGVIGWGRWTSGLFSGSCCGESGTLQDFHYVVGKPTSSTEMLALGGTATYSLLGGTRPTGNDGGTPGTLNSGALSVNFGAGTVGVALNYTYGGNAYDISSPSAASFNYLSGSAFFSGSGISTTGAACASGCSSDLSGFFAGANAARAGLVYRTFDFASSLQIFGAAGFNKN